MPTLVSTMAKWNGNGVVSRLSGGSYLAPAVTFGTVGITAPHTGQIDAEELRKISNFGQSSDGQRKQTTKIRSL